MKPFIRRYSPVATIFVAFALASAQSAHAVNAAWNTDAATGDFGSPNWTSGVTVPAAGGTYVVVSGDALFFGTSTTTTLNNDLSGATYNGLTFNSGASAFTIGGNSFTLNGNITNNSASLQTINNDMTLIGARTFAATSGQLVFGGNITGNPTGSWTLTPTNKITLGGTNNVTMSANFAGLLINAGSGGVDITGSTTISGAAGNQQSGYLSVAGNSTVTVQSGGSFTINGTTNATPNSIIGQNAAGTSTLHVNGGSFTIGSETGFVLGNNVATATGVMTITSGTATINAGSTTATDIRSYVALGRDLANGTINLNGGTLASGRVFVRDGGGATANGGTANFVFGGGTLKALANQTDWLKSTTTDTYLQALSSVTTTSANSTIDSNGFSVAINNNISGAGGFNITSSTGTGTVTFGGANTYAGGTTVLSGNLATDLVGNFGLGNVTVADVAGAGLILGNGNSIADTAILFFGDAGTITLNNAISDTVFGITQTDDSQSIGAGVHTASDLNTFFGVTSFTGTGTLTVVPEPTTALLGGLGLLGLLRRRRVA